MNVNLLFQDKDWVNTKAYYDWNSVVKDLRLNILFDAAKSTGLSNRSQEIMEKHNRFLQDTMKKVMSVPLTTKEEILYRQAIMQDCYNREGFVTAFYDLVENVLEKWNELGRRSKNGASRDSKAALITEIRIIKHLISSVAEVKKYMIDNIDRLESAGFQNFYDRLLREFSDDYELKLFHIMEDLSFYVDVSEIETKNNQFKAALPRIQLDCSLKDGLKLGDFKLETFATTYTTLRKQNGLVSKIQGSLNSLAPNYISLYKNTALKDNAAELEYQVVNYVVACCGDFMSEFGQFFDQLHMQLGFYYGAINLRHRMQQCHVNYSFPRVGKKCAMHFTELKELAMCLEYVGKVVDNSLSLDSKDLTLVTGANQGGKSTFLRSIGIAQVMLQCGMSVPATDYVSDLYPALFTHFTRREDSAMNSGRLDEELRRMSHILDQIEGSSLLLLNESFASTTEVEGSKIAYDIIKALTEEGVRVITVTHLLSFAKKVYAQEQGKESSSVAFLSAERLENGERTFKMKNHEPELTSFGLDLFNEMIGGLNV